MKTECLRTNISNYGPISTFKKAIIIEIIGIAIRDPMGLKISEIIMRAQQFAAHN